MQFEEMGNMEGKTLMLLPGTGCVWQTNFKNALGELGKYFHLICVNYDGFDGDKSVVFPGMIPVTEKIEEYVRLNHGGKLDGVYGSSLGGSFVGLLIQRKRIHIDHGFIGSSDLDQGNKLVAKLMTLLIAPLIKNSTSEKGRKKFIKSLEKNVKMEITEELEEQVNDFIDDLANLNPESLKSEYYSDYITPLEDDIYVEGTRVHIIYALKMGSKYEKRYKKHFRNPDIRRFDMQHEGWIFEKKWAGPVMETIVECME